MEIGSRTYPNVTANSREADKVFNPEIKEYYAPPPTGTVDGDVIPSAPSVVGLSDISGINTTVSSAGGIDTATVAPSTFTFPPLRNDLNSAPTDTEYPSFTSFGDSIASQPEAEPALEEETQQVTVQEAFDDMVVLKDGMVTSASLSYERFQTTDGHLQEAEDPEGVLAADAEKIPPKTVITETSAEESVDVVPQSSAGLETDVLPSQVPVGGLGLDLEADVTKESFSEAPGMEAEVEEVPVAVDTLETQTQVYEQPSFEEAITEQETIQGVETAERESAMKESPAIAGELPSEKLLEEDVPSESLPDGEPPSEKPPEGDHPLEIAAEVDIASEMQPNAEPSKPIELSEGEETQQEPAKHVYEVSEEDIQAIKGQKVLKKFGKKDFLGDVVNYDPETRWFKVVYEDGDEEDLEIVEVKPLLIPPGTSSISTKKKRPRTDGDADEEMNKSSKKPKKSVAESSKSPVRQKSTDGSKSKKQKETGAKKFSKSPAKPDTKSPGSKSKTAKKSAANRKQKKPVKESKSSAKQEVKGKSKIKSEEVLDSPPAKSPGKSSTKKGTPKSRTRTPNSSKRGTSKLTKNAEVSEASDLKTPKARKTGTGKRGAKTSGGGKGKKGRKLKSPATEIKVEDTPKSSKVGTKRKIDVDEPAQVSNKRSRKGGAEKETVPSREIDRVGEATFIGKPVRKDFDGTLFDGVVVSYDKKSKYFKVKYDDGDQEDLEWRELELILVSEGKSDVDTEAKPAKVGLLSTLMSQEKKTGRSSAKKRKST